MSAKEPTEKCYKNMWGGIQLPVSIKSVKAVSKWAQGGQSRCDEDKMTGDRKPEIRNKNNNRAAKKWR